MNRTKRGINLIFTFLFLLTAGVCVLSVKGIDIGQNATVLKLDKNVNSSVSETGAFNIVYQSTAKTKDKDRKYLYVCGAPFGIKLYTNGVVIVGSDSILTKDGYINPAEVAGLKQGDIITHVNGKTVKRNSELSKYLAESNGQTVTLNVVRDGNEMKINFVSVLSDEDNRYKAGLWVRDSSAGIGTLTFYDEQMGMFCGLGHGVNDIDTGKLVPLLEGEAVGADITGSYKGTEGNIGELIGVFNDKIIGSIVLNSATGVYGYYTKEPPGNGILYPLASKGEVKTGKAQILSTVDGNGPKLYDIEITKIDSKSPEKNLVINVTDASLIANTGGIVQGMSGSPIIQNGMIIGAVTHVFVDNPKGGYGIFAETMYNDMTALNQNKTKNAA